MRAPMMISRMSFWLIAVYYIGVLSGGLIIYPYAVLATTIGVDITLAAALKVAVASSLTTCAVYYLRKLYKDSLQQEIANGLSASLYHDATVLYFLCRPLFASVVAVLVTLGVYEFVTACTEAPLTVHFLYLTTITAASIGIATGESVRRLEIVATDHAKVVRGQ